MSARPRSSRFGAEDITLQPTWRRIALAIDLLILAPVLAVMHGVLRYWLAADARMNRNLRSRQAWSR